MKFMFFLFVCFMAGCRPDAVDLSPCPAQTDTIYVPQLRYVQDTAKITQLQIRMDSLDSVNSHLADRLLHSRLVISNARYYVNLCNRKPSQDKFLRGWMNRVLAE